MRISLRHVNNTLLAAIIVVNLYIIAAPLTPSVIFWWQSHHTNRQQTLSGQLHRKSSQPTTPAAAKPNQLIVPSMLLDTPLLDGPVKDTYKILDKGVWRWPLGSTPDKGGNTVLIGHRFTYTNPKGIFYYLNKIQPNDEIGVIWNNKTYIYKVTSVSVIPPTNVGITAPTRNARLTMYTCTPLWLPKDRLVVVAELEQS